MNLEEVLVILAPGVRQRPPQAEVTQAVSPRVFLARHPGPARLEDWRARPDVMVAAQDALPDAVLESLDDGERLFVEAWMARRRAPAKQRPGEGLPWDAPGRQAPDPPSP